MGSSSSLDGNWVWNFMRNGIIYSEAKGRYKYNSEFRNWVLSSSVKFAPLKSLKTDIIVASHASHFFQLFYTISLIFSILTHTLSLFITTSPSSCCHCCCQNGVDVWVLLIFDMGLQFGFVGAECLSYYCQSSSCGWFWVTNLLGSLLG